MTTWAKNIKTKEFKITTKNNKKNNNYINKIPAYSAKMYI
jgi:hypothetical protein